MENEARGLMKKAIFVLALIIAIISLCHSVSAAKLTQLTTNETDEYDPAWSPDGKKIAYAAPKFLTFVHVTVDIIWVMESDGKNKEEYLDDPMIIKIFEDGSISKPSRPTWSPDGPEMAIGYGGSIWIPPGKRRPGDPGRLTSKEDEIYKNTNPAWSPDGIQIAFTSIRSGNKDIWLMNDDGRNLIQLTKHKSIDEHPAWSPDASKVAFASYRSGNADIWVMDRDGSNLKQLSSDKSKDFYPAWSSDGTKIAFVSDRSGNKDIWVMSSDGKNAMELTTNESNDESPTWWSMSSQEKMKIAFTSERAGNKDIWVMEFSEDELAKGEGGGQSKIFEWIKRYLPYLSAAILILALFKPLMLRYYRAKMKKWEKEGYDVSKLKEVLGDEK